MCLSIDLDFKSSKSLIINIGDFFKPTTFQPELSDDNGFSTPDLDMQNWMGDVQCTKLYVNERFPMRTSLKSLVKTLFLLNRPGVAGTVL